MKKSKKTTVPLVETVLKRHFRRQSLQELVTASRTFLPTARVDIQLALDKIFSKQPDADGPVRRGLFRAQRNRI